MNNIAILIPCLNEETTIYKVVKDFKQVLPEALIYVGDNNSTDNTSEEASKAGAIIINEYRRGKGHVVKAMFERVNADIYIMVDGDDTYPANRVLDLIKPIIDNEADMVIGSRLCYGNKGLIVKGFKPMNLFGNLIYRKMVNWIFKSDLTDILSGYRVFNNKVIKTIPLFLKGFEVETELTIKAIERGFRIKEIPVDLSERQEGSKSKIKILKDGVRILRTIVSLFRDYKPLTFFGASGLVFLTVGLFFGFIVIAEYFSTGLVLRFPLAILSVGIVLSSIVWIIAGIILHTIDRRVQELESTMLSIWKEINQRN
ncbi:MAG: glycosyltransferase family 2 protein [Anaerolineaceae bacterium]|nr:glycosyltransferase family 2 protein [Anaerolineaceae bacterium]